MRYQAIFSAIEAQILMSLMSQPLDLLEADHVRARIHSGKLIIIFQPMWVSTPDKSHRDLWDNEIICPDVQIFSEKRFGRTISFPKSGTINAFDTELSRRELGKITDISIVNTFLTFSNFSKPEPDSFCFELTFSHPDVFRVAPSSEEARQINETYVERALIEADLGIQIKTDKGHRVLIHTDGLVESFRVFVLLDGQIPDYLDKTVELLPLTSRL
ncbi:hypothetical protein HYR54_05425 [Candidatus Acetothermia bacterium]|nr:hypothetical protein [Candidatus Acetothermia bacterium]